MEAAKTAQVLRTWEDMRSVVEGNIVGKELIQKEKDREEGLAPHTNAKVRYFSEKREKPRITLYRDDAAWCPYCQKVWLLCEAKEIDYAVSKVNMRSYGDKPKAFLQKVPRGLLPAIEIDGQCMTESLDIMFTIEETFRDDSRPMFPRRGAERERAVKLLELERAIFGAWCGYLFRPEIPFLGGSSSDFQSAMKQMDEELAREQSSPWFLPYQHPTIVDMQYVSHVERMVASVMFYKGFDVRGQFRHIDAWLTAFEALPYYMASKSDYYTHCKDIPPQYGEPYPNDSEMAVRARDLLDAKSARLPIAWATDPEPRTVAQTKLAEIDYAVEAAWSIVRNHEAIAKFCCRAAGDDVGAWASGDRTKSELADPYARPNLDFVALVDALLRSVASALLQGDPTQVSAGIRDAADEAKMPPEARAKAAACLAYLRDRIGVPRDMQMPAAKVLRAYLGEAVSALRS